MIRTAALFLCLAGLALALSRRDAVGARSGRELRPAGPDQMRDPPPDWSATDERSDESFPASDPPGTY